MDTTNCNDRWHADADGPAIRNASGKIVLVAFDTRCQQQAAAAPEMLAALRLVIDDFGDDYGGPTMDAVRAAIAKAEGRANG